MTHNFEYLKDSEFLKRFDEMKLKEQFVKIIVLTFNEQPIQQIQGKVLGGNFSLDGSSGMRRTCNLNILADEYENDLTDTKHLLSINKKVEILIGFVNNTGEYEKYPILWFPQGTYIITSPNISHNNGGVSISLTLHDKMALLNGQCGGVLSASVVFHEYQNIDENGETYITRPTIYQIIQELVNHFGGEQLGKIIISDIDSKIKQVMKWSGSTPLYFYTETIEATVYNRFTTNYYQVKDLPNYKTFNYGDDIGYILVDFTYPTELIGNAGDTVVTILDQIKNTLGNYEYFYDVNGNFRFQEIKNYLNTSYSTFLINEINADNYLANYSSGKSVYTFEDANIIQSYSNSPQYQQIKNDFLVWGKRTSITDQQIPIRYHLAIDKKPPTGNTYEVFFYIDPDDEIEKAKTIPEDFKFASRLAFPSPSAGQLGAYYYARDTKKIWILDRGTKNYEETAYKLETITAKDWRTELYMQGVVSQAKGLDANYYYTELKNEWPKLYDMRNQKFFDEVIAQPSDIDFFLDFIDSSTEMAQFSVQNIGRRTSANVDDSINCVFEPDNPDIVLIQSGSDEAAKTREECEKRHQDYSQVRSEIYSMLLYGGSLKSAYEEIKKQLYQYTNYNEQVSLTVLPIYYLEPNERITVRDPESGIYGDYMIKSISLPLDSNGTMSLSCTRALERI